MSTSQIVASSVQRLSHITSSKKAVLMLLNQGRTCTQIATHAKCLKHTCVRCGKKLARRAGFSKQEKTFRLPNKTYRGFAVATTGQRAGTV